jgi:hypothetical protein
MEEKQWTFEELEHRATTAQKELRMTVMGIIELGLKVFASRALVLYSMTISGGLFVFASIDPSPMRIACASCFTLFVFIPVLLRRGKDGDDTD